MEPRAEPGVEIREKRDQKEVAILILAQVLAFMFVTLDLSSHKMF